MSGSPGARMRELIMGFRTTQLGSDRFALTALSEQLRSATPGSMRPLAVPLHLPCP
jgi:hypothetical protein